MKKRTKITLRTKIYLTIVLLLSLTGVFYAANPVPFTIDTPGVSVNWQWAAANYPTFTNAYNLLGVKPVDDKVQNPYLNADHAGTPENFKPFVIAGATGGGSNNYTGSLGPTKSVGPCQP